MSLIETERVVAVFGGGSSSISIQGQFVFQQALIPQVAYTSTSPTLSNDEMFPTFSRTVPPDSLQGPALASVCKEMGWNTVGMISTTDEYASKVMKQPAPPSHLSCCARAPRPLPVSRSVVWSYF